MRFNVLEQSTMAGYAMPTPVRIARIETDNYRTRTLVLDAALPATPGQFIMAWLPRFDEKPFSLVNSDPVTLMVTAVGPFSRLVHGLQPGDRLWLRGPFGQSFDVPAADQRIALVGGGYGVAPLLWLARTQADRARRITAIIGARTAQDILYADRFQRLADFRPPAPSEYDLVVTTEDGTAGLHGRVTDALTPLLEAQAIDGIYACGPDGMLAALRALAGRYGIPCQLSWEAYMRCGIGICGACEHEGRVLCLDGPVLGA
jgi:dihydroorotate dehydrogenase electron transfer subunit